MRNRIWGPLALGSVLLASTAYAENCKPLTLYENSQSSGFMEESTRFFPEAPEWTANWGNFDGMNSPYIRLSGMRNYRSDWTGSLIFDNLPATVQGGALKLKVRSTQNANFGIWLSGSSGNGKISFHSLEAGKTHSLDIPIDQLVSEDFQIDKVGIGLFNVPANQYTTLFVDDILLTCTQEIKSGEISSEENFVSYTFTDTDPSSAERTGLFEYIFERPVKSRYTTSEQELLKTKSSTDFIIPEASHEQILHFKDADTLTARNSWRGWYNSLFLIEKGKLVEGSIPNSKRIFDEAGTLAATSDYTVLPLLVANISYGIAYCADTSCINKEFEDYHLELVGLPTPYVTSSKVHIAYDPYFTISPSGILPTLELCTSKKCLELTPKSEGVLEFESAGLQKILVKIHSDNKTFEQKLFVEVQ